MVVRYLQTSSRTLLRWLPSSIVIVCAAISTPETAHAQAKRKRVPPPSYAAAEKHLHQGHYTNAQKECRSLASDKYLDPWKQLCLARAALGLKQNSEALRLLKSIAEDSVAFLYARALRASIDAAKEPEDALNEVKRVRALARDQGILEIEPELKFAELSVLYAGKQLPQSLQQAQQLRREAPKSSAARRAYELQKLIVPTPGKPLPSSQTFKLDPAEYWNTELELLIAQGFNTEALALSADLKNRAASLFPAPEAQTRFLDTRWKLLKNLKRTSELNTEIKTLSTNKKHSLHLSANRVAAKNAWRRNAYDEALKLITSLPRDDYERLFIEGRIAEARGEIAEAERIFRQIMTQRFSPHRGGIGLRLAWLLIYQRRWDEFGRVVTAVKDHSAAFSTSELQALNYWSTRPLLTRGSALGKPTPFPANSYYFWLSEGFSIIDPEAARPRTALDFQSCEVSDILLQPERRKRVERLKDLGFENLASQELRYSLPPLADEKGAIARARVLSNEISVPAAWRELAQAQPVALGIRGECGREFADLMYPLRFLDLYEREGKRHGVEVPLLLALSRTESAFNPRALSPVGARGLMQLMPATARMEGFPKQSPVSKLFDPAVNIPLGTKHLARLIREFDGQWYLAVASYNAGRGAVQRWQARYPDAAPEAFVELIPYQETRDYVKKVLTTYWIYKALLSGS